MNQKKLIEKLIMKKRRGKIFFLDTLTAKYPKKIVSSVLTELVKDGRIRRIVRGMYVRPKKLRIYKGYITPHAHEIMKVIARRTGEIISEHGAVATYQLGLSTQIPVRALFNTSGRSRRICLESGDYILLKHVNAKYLIKPKSITCRVISAFLYQGKSCVTPRKIKILHDNLGEKGFNEVIQNIDKMPGWMREAFVRYQGMRSDHPDIQEKMDEWWQG